MCLQVRKEKRGGARCFATAAVRSEAVGYGEAGLSATIVETYSITQKLIAARTA